ncbi:MAG: ribosome recycling factor [Legionellales bacterium]|nr:ribosome recycling factor [Legionellales bacterium]
MAEQILKDAESRMGKTIEALIQELAKIRTGRAHPSLLDSVVVPYYGADVPLSQVANVTTGDSRMLLVTPWEKSMVAAIEKAIMQANLGLNPASVGELIRVPLPPLTEERRKELIKVVKQEIENAKVAIRNIRRDANNHFKECLKAKEINEDDDRKYQDLIQKMTDKNIAEIDKVFSAKEKDLMSI